MVVARSRVVTPAAAPLAATTTTALRRSLRRRVTTLNRPRHNRPGTHLGGNSAPNRPPEPTAPSYRFHRLELLERLQRRANHVDRVAAAGCLGQDALDARCLEDRTRATAGDHAGSRRRRLQEDARRAKTLLDRMRDRRASQWHGDHRFLS